MYRAKNAIRSVWVAGVVLAGVFAAFSQSEGKQAVPSYQVSLQFLVGTNDGGRREVPASLSSITRELKNNFGFSNYHVAATLLGRVGSGGNYEYKSVSNIFGTEPAPATPTFLEWTLHGLHGVNAEKGRALEGSAFRIGARVPVFTAREDGNKSMNVSYENIGITAMRFGLAENTPTLMGTLSLPNGAGTVFLVVTARAVE